MIYLLNIFLKFLVTLCLFLSLEIEGGGGEAVGQEMMTIGETDISTG